MKKILNILVVEDDKYFRLAIKREIDEFGLIDETDSLDGAKELLNHNKYDLCIIDLNLGENKNNGLEVIKECKRLKVKSLVLSSTNNDQVTEKVYELGCEHFLIKSKFKNHLSYYIKKLSSSFELELDNFFKNEFITKNKQLKSHIKELLQYDLRGRRILITGETGVGKSLLGKLIHETHFKDQSLVHLNCSEISETLIESELFGHVKGSFTGANKDKVGLITKANNGILFLDEIATMPLSMQKKLLNVLENGVYYPVGSETPLKSSFTLISATCEDLIQKVHLEEFRKDLFFRISGINIEIPTLRERPEDIKLLVKHFIAKSPRKVLIKDCALEVLLKMKWEGNTRELKRKIDQLVFSTKGIITKDELSFDTKTNYSENETLLTQNHEEFILNFGLRLYMKKVETEITKALLAKNNGKVAKTIKELKISASAFYRIQESI